MGVQRHRSRVQQAPEAAHSPQPDIACLRFPSTACTVPSALWLSGWTARRYRRANHGAQAERHRREALPGAPDLLRSWHVKIEAWLLRVNLFSEIHDENQRCLAFMNHGQVEGWISVSRIHRIGVDKVDAAHAYPPYISPRTNLPCLDTGAGRNRICASASGFARGRSATLELILV